MVARTPPKQRNTMVASPLSPTLLKETLKKVDKCMERLQELQYTVTGGNKVVSGVKLSPKSTKAYLKTSLRCKQESMRIKNNASKKSPTGKLPANVTGDWRRMSLSAMLVGETVAEILQTSKTTTEIMRRNSKIDDVDPKTPLPQTRKQRPNQQKTSLETRRRREKQHQFRIIRPESSTPSLRKARSKINFKVSPEKRPEIEKEKKDNGNDGSSSVRHQFRVIRAESSTPSSLRKARSRMNFKISPEKRTEIEKEQSNLKHLANRVSPKHKPWAKKAVLFPNPLFHSSSPNSKNQQFCKTKSPLIAKKRETPHKFLVKSPVKIKSPTQKGLNNSVSPVRTKNTTSTNLSRKSPPKVSSSMASKLRRSLSPSRLANRFVSPLKGRRISMNGISNCDNNGLKQRPPPLMMMPMRFSNHRFSVGGPN